MAYRVRLPHKRFSAQVLKKLTPQESTFRVHCCLLDVIGIFRAHLPVASVARDPLVISTVAVAGYESDGGRTDASDTTDSSLFKLDTGATLDVDS